MAPNSYLMKKVFYATPEEAEASLEGKDGTVVDCYAMGCFTCGVVRIIDVETIKKIEDVNGYFSHWQCHACSHQNGIPVEQFHPIAPSELVSSKPDTHTDQPALDGAAGEKKNESEPDTQTDKKNEKQKSGKKGKK
jgi:hypothetical protein